MFTGIIEGQGTVEGLVRSGGIILTVTASFPLRGTRVGDSIAVNGACLTAVELSGDTFRADVSPETASRTGVGKLSPGSRVNLERALLATSRLDGHLVTGH
ncbi:MAG: riboflavin synthase, partial [Thermodesulfobacteriota bacterium]